MRSFKSIETTFIPRISTLEVGLEDEWELYPSDVTMGSMLGEGAFGLVYKGYLKGPLTNTKVKPEFRNQIHIPIAMKLLKGMELLSNTFWSCDFFFLFLKIQRGAVKE